VPAYPRSANRRVAASPMFALVVTLPPLIPATLFRWPTNPRDRRPMLEGMHSILMPGPGRSEVVGALSAGVR
jgi:hypothetical protein